MVQFQLFWQAKKALLQACRFKACIDLQIFWQQLHIRFSLGPCFISKCRLTAHFRGDWYPQALQEKTDPPPCSDICSTIEANSTVSISGSIWCSPLKPKQGKNQTLSQEQKSIQDWYLMKALQGVPRQYGFTQCGFQTVLNSMDSPVQYVFSQIQVGYFIIFNISQLAYW